MRLKDRLSKKELQDLYHVEKLSIRKIALLYDVSDMTVYHLTKENDIPRRSGKEKK